MLSQSGTVVHFTIVTSSATVLWSLITTPKLIRDSRFSALLTKKFGCLYPTMVESLNESLPEFLGDILKFARTMNPCESYMNLILQPLEAYK